MNPSDCCIRHVFASLVAVMWLGAMTANAQLLSPGELAAPHAALEGVANCTACHTIGGKGVDQDKCLSCHEPIRARIDAATGLHATFEDPCTTCHKEHLGLNFGLVRFDTTSFEHELTGFELLGAHARTKCASCHSHELLADEDILAALTRGEMSGRTYLGLATGCVSCHAEVNPHEYQFEARECSGCHDSESWKEAPGFDHKESDFPLAGRHADVACSKCHPGAPGPDGEIRAQFSGIAYGQCTTCHADPHENAFGSLCNSCHSPDGWSQIVSEHSFRHERTGYVLSGAHNRLACRSCHRKPARDDDSIRITFVEKDSEKVYQAVTATSCLSCHRDYHEGSFRQEAAAQSCDACHTASSWIPTTFGIERHNESSRFELTGAHLSVQCGACHKQEDAKPTFYLDQHRCDACHAGDNPHGSQFDSRMIESSCGSCHTTDAWNRDLDFDHASTKFPLLGSHTHLACTACHVQPGVINTQRGIDYTGLSMACASCHKSADPHQGQFEDRDCRDCHDATAFVPVSTRFDHDKTRFSLSGAHEKVACAVCHEITRAPDGAPFARYLTGKNQCVDCHSSD